MYIYIYIYIHIGVNGIDHYIICTGGGICRGPATMRPGASRSQNDTNGLTLSVAPETENGILETQRWRNGRRET